MERFLRGLAIFLVVFLGGPIAWAYLLGLIVVGGRPTPYASVICFAAGIALAWWDASRQRAQVGPEVARPPILSPVQSPVPSGATIAATVPSGAKTCPDCAETIQAAARICRFCRHEFPALTERSVGDHELVGHAATPPVPTLAAAPTLTPTALAFDPGSGPPGALTPAKDRVGRLGLTTTPPVATPPHTPSPAPATRSTKTILLWIVAGVVLVLAIRFGAVFFGPQVTSVELTPNEAWYACYEEIWNERPGYVPLDPGDWTWGQVRKFFSDEEIAICEHYPSASARS